MFNEKIPNSTILKLEFGILLFEFEISLEF